MITKFEHGPNWKERAETNLIVIHSSLTPASRDDGIEYLRSRHMRQGCIEVGYHYVIRRNGVIEQGRPLHATGSHCGERDRDSIGICMIGGGDNKRRAKGPDYTSAQMRTLAYLCLSLVRIYPEAEVCGHNRTSPASSCPVFNITDWWVEVSVNLKSLDHADHPYNFPLGTSLQVALSD